MARRILLDLAGIAATLTLVGCYDMLGPIDHTPIVLPADDPGLKVAVTTDCCSRWTPSWNPATGKLIAPVFTGRTSGGYPVYPLSFAVLSIDPLTGKADTIGRGGEEGFAALRVAADGAVYFSMRKQLGGVQLRRVLPGDSARVVSTPKPPLGEFVVNTDGTRLLARTDWSVLKPNFILSGTSAGDSLGALPLTQPRAISHDGLQVLDGYEVLRIHGVPTGVSRALDWRQGAPQNAILLDAAWVDDRFRLLLIRHEYLGAKNRRSIYEWDETAGAVLLGSFESEGANYTYCVAWSPALHRAVMAADSVTDFAGSGVRSHMKYVAMSGGKATTFGSANIENAMTSPTCSLSPDGTWFALWSSAGHIYMKKTP